MMQIIHRRYGLAQARTQVRFLSVFNVVSAFLCWGPYALCYIKSLNLLLPLCRHSLTTRFL